jgi:nucleoside-diphosphate-sugar epimerase
MEGTSRLIEAALRAGVEFYLQQSSVSAYIDGGDRWLDEETPFDIVPARAPMTLALADMERRVREIPARRMGWAILRLGQLLGPGTPEAILARDLEEGRAEVPGDGSHFISPVHAADAAAAFVHAVRGRARQMVLNIVDEPVRYGDYLGLLAARVGAARPSANFSRLKSPSHRCSNGAARKALDWIPCWGLRPGLRLALGA